MRQISFSRSPATYRSPDDLRWRKRLCSWLSRFKKSELTIEIHTIFVVACMKVNVEGTWVCFTKTGSQRWSFPVWLLLSPGSLPLAWPQWVLPTSLLLICLCGASSKSVLQGENYYLWIHSSPKSEGEANTELVLSTQNRGGRCWEVGGLLWMYPDTLQSALSHVDVPFGFKCSL